MIIISRASMERQPVGTINGPTVPGEALLGAAAEQRGGMALSPNERRVPRRRAGCVVAEGSDVVLAW